MVTQSTNNLFAPYDKIKKHIAQVSELYDYSHILSSYIDKNSWIEKIKSCMSIEYIDNLTDFNYSKCFNYILNENDIELYLVDEKFKEYLIENGELFRTELLISALSPYMFYKHIKYRYSNNSIVMETSSKPYTDYQKKVAVMILNFAKGNNLSLISDKDLKKTISNISLELSGTAPSVYSFLFEDSSAKFPYD